MTKTDDSKTSSPTPEVEDPHPGSISDGTHPAAKETKQPKATKGGAERVSPSGAKQNLKEGRKR
ncbi:MULTISPECIES: hypothetical protein [unclassified Rhizobium]|uniref:hypothetical protein n=1 Tax=unclassified Rhizobium TaxID=2613769 RepID=UPI000AE5A9E7|nr:MULTISPECIES: hypothetical protein [unclassified Rhizobium]